MDLRIGMIAVRHTGKIHVGFDIIRTERYHIASGHPDFYAHLRRHIRCNKRTVQVSDLDRNRICVFHDRVLFIHDINPKSTGCY